MGGDPDREEPFFFTKPADALVINGADMPYPSKTGDLHHEMELVVAIGTGGRDIAEAEALAHVYGYAAGLDMTRRDLQAAAKKGGKPWDMAKGFDHSGPIGEIVPASKAGHPAAGKIELVVNGVPRQSSDLAKQIWNVPETIAYLSGLVELAAGRPDLHRHARGRRRRGRGRCAGRRDRRRRHGAHPHRLTTVCLASS